MKQIIILIMGFLLTSNIFAQNLNCRSDTHLLGNIETGNYPFVNELQFFGGIIESNANVIVTAGAKINIDHSGNGIFIADSKNGSSFLAYIKECENIESEVLIACNNISREIMQEEYAGRKNPNPNQSGVEYSDLAFYPAENMLFMPLDDAITNEPNNTIFVDGADRHAIRAYDLDNATEYAITLTNMPANFVLHHPDDDNNPDADFEGITYLYDSYFALIDEATRIVYFLEYSDLHKELNYISSFDLSLETASYIGSAGYGIEGLSYNPHLNKLYLVSEGLLNGTSTFIHDIIIFELDISANTDLSNPQLVKTREFNLSQKLKGLNNQNLFKDASGIFHLSKMFPAGNESAERILILSQQSKKIMEMDMEGNIYGSLMNVSGEFQPEGLAFIPINNVPQIVVSSEGQKLDANDNEAHITAKISNYNNSCVNGGSPKLVQQISNHTTIAVSPNPIISESLISYNLVSEAEVSIYVTDVLGKQIATLVNGEQKQAGLNEVMFDASELPTGVYFCSVRANDKVSTHKLIKANK